LITHEQANELIAAFALDAVPSDERERMETHLNDCPRCREELDSLRGVATALAYSVETVPEGLWPNISRQLPLCHGVQPPTMPVPIRPGVARETANEPSLRLRPLRSRRARAATAVTFAAAGAITAVCGFNVGSAQNQGAHQPNATVDGANAAVAAALRVPGRKIVMLGNPDHSAYARFVVLRDGRGFLMKAALPAVSADQTYQLWGTIGGQTISLGILGRTPRQAAFTLKGSPHPSRLGISAEPAGGSIQPSGPMVASGRL